MSAAEWPVEASKVAAIYARISKDKGHDKLGTTRQRVELREFAAERDWIVDREYVDDDISASKGKARPEYERLLSDVAAGGIDIVLVTEVTRLARRMADLVQVVKVVSEANTSIHALRAGHIDLSTSGGQLQAHIMGAVAQHEVKQMSERIRSKKAEIARSGGWSGGSRPFGYDVVNGKLVVNRAEEKLIRSWVCDILAGQSVTSLAVQANADGVPTVRGGRWTTPTINQILASPRIIGMTSSGGEPVAKAHWPAIIKRDQWEAVQGVLATRKRGPAPRKTLLAGLVWCGVCGERMYGAARGDTRPRLYSCQKAANPSRSGCGRMSIIATSQREAGSAGGLDDYIVGLVLGAAGRANLSMLRAERHVKDNERLIREVADDEQELVKLAEDVGHRRISRAEWIAARGPIEKRLTDNRNALKALGVSDRLPPGLATLDHDTWEALTFEQKREVIKLFIDRITVDPIGPASGGTFQPEKRLRVSWKS